MAALLLCSYGFYKLFVNVQHSNLKKLGGANSHLPTMLLLIIVGLAYPVP